MSAKNIKDSKDDSKQDMMVETHPFAPVLPENATVMMMGTFPPTEDKWAMPFHYPNFYNDMWRIYGRVFFENAEYFQVAGEKRFDPERIVEFMHERGIASCPTVRQAVREQGNAADKHLTVVTPVDLAAVLKKVPQVTTIFTTGGKATEILLELANKGMGEGKQKIKMPKTNEKIDFPFGSKVLQLCRLPSSSRAYPLSLDKKVAAYRDFFEAVGKL